MRWASTTWRKVAVGGLAVLAFGALAYQLWGRDPLAEVPDKPELRSAWGCQNCGTIFHLTPKDRYEWQQESYQYTLGGYGLDDQDTGDAGRTSIRELILLCPDCGEVAVHKAAHCPHCGEDYAPLRKGEPQVCPGCGRGPTEGWAATDAPDGRPHVKRAERRPETRRDAPARPARSGSRPRRAHP
jgi:predicted RNA-binding Zn-ribbon protein involved in translation (DUF1610 family)